MNKSPVSPSISVWTDYCIFVKNNFVNKSVKITINILWNLQNRLKWKNYNKWELSLWWKTTFRQLVTIKIIQTNCLTKPENSIRLSNLICCITVKKRHPSSTQLEKRLSKTKRQDRSKCGRRAVPKYEKWLLISDNDILEFMFERLIEKITYSRGDWSVALSLEVFGELFNTLVEFSRILGDSIFHFVLDVEGADNVVVLGDGNAGTALVLSLIRNTFLR